MASVAVRRLLKELKELRSEECPDFTVEVEEDNMLVWRVVLFGPRDTPYAGGRFEVILL